MCVVIRFTGCDSVQSLTAGLRIGSDSWFAIRILDSEWCSCYEAIACLRGDSGAQCSLR